ncbi:hypothetical protein EXU57_09035 [Segetibacter sp. 3557_3]|uniref:hypothetical protein n=1 Tax=Segetibacter sp. 3557_3 TaxID=2547429 RepID=UPI00105911AC|nr:hypothetical protein [Segetibacter sp. 3557_3]TDH26939.1 hypothetical protein EXU57_09035 [Segetibacter sp. 3557_3]
MGTIRIFASVLLISIYTIVSYNILVEHVETKKLVQQVIRFCLTLLLMYFVFRGKKWAVVIFTFLFLVGSITALLSLFSNAPGAGKIPLVVMVLIYALAVYHLNFSKSFKEYFKSVST